MEFDFGTTIIGGIVVAILALPFVLANRARKTREKIFLRSLSEIASQNGCQIDQHEEFGKFAIGIDAAKNFVFFYKQTKDKAITHSVDLSEIQSCKVSKPGRNYKDKEGNHTAIERLELSFIPVAGNKPEVKMEFYNSAENGQMTGELQSIDAWSQRINERLKQTVSASKARG